MTWKDLANFLPRPSHSTHLQNAHTLMPECVCINVICALYVHISGLIIEAAYMRVCGDLFRRSGVDLGPQEGGVVK